MILFKQFTCKKIMYIQLGSKQLFSKNNKHLK